MALRLAVWETRGRVLIWSGLHSGTRYSTVVT